MPPSKRSTRSKRKKKTPTPTPTPSAPPPPSSTPESTPGSALDWIADALSRAAVADDHEPERKQKKVAAAATGLVSGVIGKGYAMAGAVRVERRDFDGKIGGEVGNSEEVEEFLCSMLGEDSGLGLGVVRDVLGHCKNDVEMAMDMLLDMSASPGKQNQTDCAKEGLIYYKDRDKTLGSTYQPLRKYHKPVQSVGYASRARVYTNDMGSSVQQPSYLSDTSKQNAQQNILESIFSIPDNSKHDEVHEPNSMNWKKVVKKLQALGPGLEFNVTGSAVSRQKASVGMEDCYHTARTDSRQHWDKMKGYYQRAAVAYSKGQRAHAAYLSEQGQRFRNLGREADEKASREIFEAKNKSIQNVVTIDLHGQHVKQAMILLKFHVLMLTYSPAIQLLRVITGCGSHGVGKGKVKQSAIGFLKKEGIEWSEENAGTLVVKVDRFKEYNFVTSESDSE